nr:putative ribonuclease H-like domain-containing protein [Tanacetum cinerariifolium]
MICEPGKEYDWNYGELARYVVSTGRVVVPTGSVYNEATNAQQQLNIQPQIITTVSNNNAKFFYLKKDEYEVWAMKMEYWITNNDMNIWKVIQNGNSLKRTRRDHDGRVTILPPTTADEHRIYEMQSKLEGLHKRYDRMQKILSQLNQLKAKPEDEDINLKFLRALPSSWSQVALTLKTKGGLELLSFDDLYYKLKILEVDVKEYTTFSSSQTVGPSHSAFVSTISASKKMSYGDSLSYSSSTTYTAPSNSKTGSHRSGNIEKLDLEEMDLKWQMAMLSVRVHKFEQKAGRKIDFDKKGSARFNKKKGRCYKCQQRGHFARECREKGGNNKQRYSSFKIKEIRKKKEDSKVLITVDMLDAIEGGAVKIYNLITRADTEEASTAGDAGEYALMGVTSEVHNCPFGCDRWDDSAFSVFTTNSEDVEGRPLFNSDSKSMSNDFVSCDDSDKSSEVNTNDFASSDFSVKSSEPKTVGIGNKVNHQNQFVLQAILLRNGKVNIPPARPQPFATGKPKVFASVPTGRQNRPFPVPTDRGYSPSTYTPYVPTMYYNHIKYGEDRWATAVKPSAGCSWKSHRKGFYWENPFPDAEDESIFDSGCSKSMIGNKERLDDFQEFQGRKVTFRGGKDTECLVLSKDVKLPDETMVTEVVRIACYVLNRVFVTSPHNKTPYALLTGNIPSVSHFKPFGYHVPILNTSDHLGKFDGKADEGYIIGYSASNKAYRCYKHDKANQSTGTQEATTNPVGTQDDDSDSDYDEQVIIVPSYPSHNNQGTAPKDTSGDEVDDSPLNPADEIFQQELARLKGHEQRATSDADRLGLGFVNDAEELQKRASATTVPPGSIPIPTSSIPVPSGDTMVSTDDVPVHTNGPTDLFFDDEPTTRFPSPSDLGNHDPSPGIFSSSSYDDEFGAALNNVASTVEVSPVTTKQINTIHPQSLIIRDHTSAVQTRSKVLVDLPEGKYAIGTNWILKNKRDARGIVVQNKARLVAQGHRQEEGIDYDEVFAPVARIEAISLVLAFASYMGFMVYQMDVKSVFLYRRIDEEVYVTQPKGFVDP